jgi:hypothetical protein
MTAIALPRPRKRQSKPARVAKSVTKTWASLKVGSTAAKTAKKVASYKVVKFVGTKTGKLLLIPLAAGGGLAAWKRLRSSSSSESEPATPYGSSVGPAATPGTVTPPKTAAGSSNGEGSISDPPAGASNPPATPPGSTS